MPMFTNNVNKEFRSDIISTILHSPDKRKTIIHDMLDLCLKNKFVGVNIDLEEVDEASSGDLVQFVQEMADAFHREGLIVSQDIPAFSKATA
uniref:CAZy families GT2/CE4/GH18 protein n=1 Tax=uncultured Prevotella sp. TaxID=159272 RepID=A0A060C3M9_9BACT|nr:CAZy families GT2/CE4/GH18 protein [uncultured Prevotella sp.]